MDQKSRNTLKIHKSTFCLNERLKVCSKTSCMTMTAFTQKMDQEKSKRIFQSQLYYNATNTSLLGYVKFTFGTCFYCSQCRFGSHLCEKQERNVVKKYVLLKQRRTGKICSNLLPQKSKQFVTKWQWLNSPRKCGNFFAEVPFFTPMYYMMKNSTKHTKQRKEHSNVKS